METNIWLEECCTESVMSSSLHLCDVLERLYDVLTVSYHHCARHVSNRLPLALIKQELKVRIFNRNWTSPLKCPHTRHFNRAPQCPVSVRAEILPLKHWNTSCFYAASLWEKRSVSVWGEPEREQNSHFLTNYSYIHGKLGEIHLTVLVNVTSVVCVDEKIRRIMSSSSSSFVFCIIAPVCYWMAASICSSATSADSVTRGYLIHGQVSPACFPFWFDFLDSLENWKLKINWSYVTKLISIWITQVSFQVVWLSST